MKTNRSEAPYAQPNAEPWKRFDAEQRKRLRAELRQLVQRYAQERIARGAYSQPMHPDPKTRQPQQTTLTLAIRNIAEALDTAIKLEARLSFSRPKAH